MSLHRKRLANNSGRGQDRDSDDIFGALPTRPGSAPAADPGPMIEALPDNALVVSDDGTITYERFQITPTGLQLAEDVTREEWDAVGSVIKAMEAAAQLAAGDWAAFANKHWSMSYEAIAELFDYEPDSLMTYASITRNVPHENRIPGLTISYYRLVTKYDAEDQPAYLGMAFKNGKRIPFRQFEKLISGKPTRDARPPTFAKDPVGYTKHTTSEFLLRLRKAKKLSSKDRRRILDEIRHLAEEIEADLDTVSRS